MKKILGFILSIIIIISTFIISGCNSNNTDSGDLPNSPDTDNVSKMIELDIDNLPILKGDSYTIAPTAYRGGEILSDVTYVYESMDTSIATVQENELTGINFGETKIIVTIKSGNKILDTKELQCKVNDNDAIYTNKVVYELYTMDNVLGVSFKTKDTILTSMYVDGTKIIDYGNITWVSGDSAIATIDNKGNITAKGAGETYVVGNYKYGNKDVVTRKIPVKILKPYLSTNLDVLFDKNFNSGYGSFEPETLLGKGYSLGKVVDVQTNKEYATKNNIIDLKNIPLGEYRFAIYEQNAAFATEVNVVVADYVINSLDDFQNIEWYACNYVALNTDLIGVGVYQPAVNSIPCFRGTFNGMGHKITGIRYGSSNQGLFGTVQDATVKNLAIQCTLSKERQGALFYRCYGAVIENIYVETNFDYAYSSGGLSDCILAGALTIKNSIVKTFGSSNSSNLGAMCARSGLMKVTYDSAYFISPLKLCSELPDSANRRFDFINRVNEGILFETEEDFVLAQAEGSIYLQGFNHYWDLSGSVPIFKSLI